MGMVLTYAPHRWRGIVAATAFAVLAAGCAGTTTPGAASAEVVTSFFPLFDVTAAVAGDVVKVRELTPPATEPHDYEPSPRDAEAISDAPLLVYLGGGFQPAVERLTGRRSKPSLDLLELLPADERTTATEPGAENAGATGFDPHVWLDPRLWAGAPELVAEALADIDAENANAYRSNAAAYRDRLISLDEEIRKALASCKRRVIVTAHAAFARLAARYDLRQEPIGGISPSDEPDARRLAELTELVKREGVRTVFTEELVSPAIADTLAREAGVRTAVLDPLESRVGERDYIAAMRANVATLRTALECT